MHLIELSPNLKGIFKELGVEEEETAIQVMATGLKELLRECEQEILEFEIKYGMPFDRFKEQLDVGMLGDPHSYPLEKDAMVWEDLVKEKQVRLESLRKMERLR
jgi:hypothetical protein